jgi:hypothetical protein
VGIKKFFSSSGRSQARLGKLIRRVENRYAQSGDRYDAMQRLLKLGTQPAILGVLYRFTVHSSKSIEDEEEKGWVYRQLTSIEPTVVLAAVKEFCLSSEIIESDGPERNPGWGWALRIVEDLADEEQEWDILDALLTKHPPGYERNANKKIQLLTHLSEIDNPRVPELLNGYIEDSDESVRFYAVEAVIDIGDERSKAPLIKRLTNPEEDSLRLRTATLNGLADLKWDVSAYASDIKSNLGSEGHSFDGTRVVK